MSASTRSTRATRDGVKGIYLINLVDEVTQFEFVGAVVGISERFLLPLLEGLKRSTRSLSSSAATRWLMCRPPRSAGPLHLAADMNEPEIMEMLLVAGADVNARTNLGGWTPLHVAEKRGEDALEAIDVLRAAGGVTMRNEGVAYLPVFGGGRDFGRDLLEEEMAYDGIHEALFAMPILGGSGGGREVRGSFTARGVEERLVFEEIGVGESLVDALLVALVDHRGESRLVFATDHYIEFQGICFDAPTGTHAAIFERSFDGSCCPWSETVYMQFDADAATLAEVYVDRRPTDEEAPSDHGQADTSAGACRWRDTVSAERLYFGHLGALMVGGGRQTSGTVHTRRRTVPLFRSPRA